MARVYAKINPIILKWARARARYNEEILAKRVGTTPDKYRQWETGDAQPTFRQLRELIVVLNQSLQTFFMSKIPDEPEPLAGMRRLPGSDIGDESSELASQVHLALEKREIALRLYEDLGEKPPSLDFDATLGQDTENLASSIRSALGVTIDKQTSWRNPHQAIGEWRSTLEAVGVLLFQIPKVDLREMRGFSFFLMPLPVIGINSKDSPRGRIFSIFHEFTHILLRETVLDPGGRSWFQIGPEFQVEDFCNRVAGAILVPSEDLTLQAVALGKKRDDVWSDQEVTNIASRYQVSRAVIVRRLWSLERISDTSYEELRRKYDSFIPRLPPQTGGDFYSNKIAHFGTLIPQLAFRAYYDNRVTVSDLSLFLGMKAKNLGEFENRVVRFNYGFRRS